MDEPGFWSLIDHTRDAAGHDAEAQAAALTALLRERSSEEIVTFDRLYRAQLRAAYRWDLWGVGYLLAGGMSDDAFDAFCDWLISRGSAVFALVLGDPESLAELDGVTTDELEAESLRHAAARAHEQAHGHPLPAPDEAPGPVAPAGEPWDEDEVSLAFPRAAARVGW